MRALLLLLLFALTGEASAQAARNQSSDPAAVRTARAVYEEVQHAAQARRLARRDTVVNCGEDGLGWDLSLWRDSAGRVRQFTVHGGSGDHAETWHFYYDGAGRLRFAYAVRGAVNGTTQEERVYYAVNGSVARRLRKFTEGPGYPFSTLDAIPTPRDWISHLCEGEH